MPTQWSEAEQVPLGCIALPFSHHIPGGQRRPPLHTSDVPCERPLPLPLGEVAERSEDGEGKP